MLVLPSAGEMQRRKVQRPALADGFKLVRNGWVVGGGERLLRAERNCLDGTQSRAETENSVDGPSNKSAATCRNSIIEFLRRQPLAT